MRTPKRRVENSIGSTRPTTEKDPERLRGSLECVLRVLGITDGKSHYGTEQTDTNVVFAPVLLFNTGIK